MTKNLVKNFIVKKITSTVIILNVFSGCGDSPYEPYDYPQYDYEDNTTVVNNDNDYDEPDTIAKLLFELTSDLEIDSNGFYRLGIDTTEWQTLYRLDGRVTRSGSPVNVIKFGWYSPYHWLIGDTLGYMIEHTGSDELWYVGYDTTYITWFNGFEVPIVNGSSYSNENGEVSTMVAPVQTMRGDTVKILYGFWDNWRYEEIIDSLEIILF